MEGLTVSETYDLISAVHNGLATEELPVPGGGRIDDSWFSMRAAEHRLVEQRSWQECAAMYKHVRPFLKRAFEETEEQGDLDLSFVVPLCEGMAADEGNEEQGEEQEAVAEADEEANDEQEDSEVKLLKSGLTLCNSSIKRHGDDSSQLLDRRGSSAFVRDNGEMSRFLETRFGVTMDRSVGMMTKEGETLAELRASLLARLGQLGVGAAELAECGEEMEAENADGEELDLEILKRSLILCEESIEKFGEEANQLLKEKGQKSLSDWYFRTALRFLKDEFGVSAVYKSNAVTREGETLADLRKVLLANIEAADVEAIVAPRGTWGANVESLKGALRWCEASIEENGGQSDLLLSQKHFSGAERFAPMLKDHFGVESAGGGLRKGTRTRAGTTLTDLQRDLLAQIVDPDRPISSVVGTEEDLLLLKGALGWCEGSIEENGGHSDLLLGHGQWPDTKRFAPILKARFGVETAHGGPRCGTRTQAGTTLVDLQRDLVTEIGDTTRLISQQIPKIAPIEITEEQKELSLLQGALGWCEASVEENGGHSDLLLPRRQWPEAWKFALILKARFGVKTARGGTRTQAGTTLVDLRRDLLAQIGNMTRLLSQQEGSNESGKRLRADDAEDEERPMQLGSGRVSEGSDSEQRQKLLAMGFDSAAIGRAMGANDSPDEVLECLLNLGDGHHVKEAVRGKRAKWSDNVSD